MGGQIFKAGEVSISFAYICLPLFFGLLHARFVKSKASKVDLLLIYYIFISVGIQGLITGIMQIFAPEVVVEYVKWPYSPFLLELGMANTAFGVMGILAPFMDKGWRAATAVGYGLFLLFTGVGHLVQIWHEGFNSGNTGGFLFSDLLVPAVIFSFLGLSRVQRLENHQ